MQISIWNNEVRSHEIDVQGIVNNACYFNYFDHARTLHFLKIGIDWNELSKLGYNFVLVHSDITFIKSLKPFQTFYIETQSEIVSKLKLVFYQKIYCKENKSLICKSRNTLACVDTTRNKPVKILDILKTLSIK